jgi:hypothetical protein
MVINTLLIFTFSAICNLFFVIRGICVYLSSDNSFSLHGTTAPHPPLAVGQSLLITETSRSHSDTPQSVGLLWMSDHHLAETSTWQHTQQTDIHTPPGRIRTRNPSKREVEDTSLRPRGKVGSAERNEIFGGIKFLRCFYYLLWSQCEVNLEF